MISESMRTRSSSLEDESDLRPVSKHLVNNFPVFMSQTCRNKCEEFETNLKFFHVPLFVLHLVCKGLN